MYSVCSYLFGFLFPLFLSLLHLQFLLQSTANNIRYNQIPFTNMIERLIKRTFYSELHRQSKREQDPWIVWIFLALFDQLSLPWKSNYWYTNPEEEDGEDEEWVFFRVYYYYYYYYSSWFLRGLFIKVSWFFPVYEQTEPVRLKSNDFECIFID